MTASVALCETDASLPPLSGGGSGSRSGCGKVMTVQLGNGALTMSLPPGGRQCGGTGDGGGLSLLFLPLIPGEEVWGHGMRGTLYGLALLYSFLGIAIIADKFMVAIEVITSKEKKISAVNERGVVEVVRVRVWNETVANLTLMALGSSAPEILLAVLEAVAQLGKPPSDGGLGAGTIVGSAAFNLLAISAICVAAIPDGQTRRVQGTGVFAVTALFSVAAYAWLVLVLAVWTPDVVTLGEALITLAMFPLLVILSYLQDIGYFRGCCGGGRGGGATVKPAAHVITNRRGSNDGLYHPGGESVSEKARLASLLKRTAHSNNDGGSSTSGDSGEIDVRTAPPSALAELAMLQLYESQPKSALHYRINAARALGAGRRVVVDRGRVQATATAMLRQQQEAEAAAAATAAAAAEAAAAAAEAKGKEGESRAAVPAAGSGGTMGGVAAGSGGCVDDEDCVIEFATHEYAVLESGQKIDITVVRQGPLHSAAGVSYETSNGSACAGEDYAYTSGKLLFAPGEASKKVSIPIVDDNEFEPDEDFFLTLKPPLLGGPRVRLGPTATARIVIINDDDPGTFSFEKPVYLTKESDGGVTLAIARADGGDGSVRVHYRTRDDGSAVAGADYTHCEGTVLFEHGEMRKEIRIPVHDDERYERDETFSVELTIHNYPDCGAQYGAVKTATVTITSDEELAQAVDAVAALLRVNMDRLRVSTGSWRQQFEEAVTVAGDGDGEPSTSDYLLHFLTFGWKCVFALVPPTSYCGGWLTFGVALAFIGLLTAFVGDIASVFGCTLGLPPSVTAITFVALGTSLPDTFASKAAAVNSPTADASIGNVTGSNSVNVFLGLGLPWTISALHAALTGSGPYIVRAGDTAFSVSVFVAAAIVCLAVLCARRSRHPVWGAGGELGGGKAGKWATAALFAGLWLTYIALSSARSMGGIQ